MGKSAKETALAAFCLTSGGVAIYLGTYWGIYNAVFGAAALIFVSSFLVAAMVVERKIIMYLTLLLLGIASLFPLPARGLFYSGALASCLVALLACRRIQTNAGASPNFKVADVARGGLGLMLTAISLLAAVFYYTGDAPNAVSVIPRGVFDFAWPYLTKPGLAEPLGMAYIQNTPASQPVDEFLRRYIESMDGGKELLKSKRGAAVMDEARVELSAKQKLTGAEPIGDALFNKTNEKINEILGSSVVYIPILLSLSVFFTLRMLSVPFGWLALGLASLTLHSGARAGIIRRKEKQITAYTYTF